MYFNILINTCEVKTFFRMLLIGDQSLFTWEGGGFGQEVVAHHHKGFKKIEPPKTKIKKCDPPQLQNSQFVQTSYNK